MQDTSVLLISWNAYDTEMQLTGQLDCDKYLYIHAFLLLKFLRAFELVNVHLTVRIKNFLLPEQNSVSMVILYTC